MNNNKKEQNYIDSLKLIFFALLEKKNVNFKSLYCHKEVLKNISIKPYKGLSNTIFQLEFLNHRFIAKRLDFKNRQLKNNLGISFKQEIKALQITKNASYSPNIFAICDDWLFLNWIEGTSLDCHGYSIICQKYLSQFAILMRNIHQHPLSPYTIDLKNLYNKLYSQISSRRQNHKFFLFHKQIIATPYPKKSSLVFDHMDMHLGNFIEYKEHLFLIDWEYSGNIELNFALCNFFNALTLNQKQKIEFLESYYQSSAQPLTVEKNWLQQKIHDIDKWQLWYDYLVFLWYEVRWSQTRDPEYLHFLNNNNYTYS